eukprot:10628374-Heterocapsa_arctica.AAC.1
MREYTSWTTTQAPLHSSSPPDCSSLLCSCPEVRAGHQQGPLLRRHLQGLLHTCPVVADTMTTS